MPSISCRDMGSDCDWFYKADDVRDVLKTDLIHSVDTHLKELKAVMKEAGKAPDYMSRGLMNTARFIRDMHPSPCTFACRDLGLSDNWSIESDDEITALATALKHWEEEHPEELKAMYKKRFLLVANDFVDALKMVEA
jgi:predicted small metal-binding protein